MNLVALKTFLAIVEVGHLNRAAELLNITQSTVNARLNGLEQALGQKLFHRRKSGAVLTSAGFRFERYAQLMTDLWRQAQQETALPAAIETVCNIGCHPDLWPVTGQQIFEQVKLSEANIATSVWPGDQQELERWLKNGLIDMALCYTSSLRDSWTAYSLAEDKLIQVSTRPRSLMRWDAGYIYVDSGEEFRRSHAAAYPDGDTPTVIFGSSVWALEYLLKTEGSAYLPERLVLPHINNETLFPVVGAVEFSRAVYLVVNDVSRQKWSWFSTMLNNLN